MAHQQTLRLALGMRGGVSLAVWIGGGVAELDELSSVVAAPGDGSDGFYRHLLSLGRYRDVEIDVMSGASAGGLNAVLASCCFVAGQRVRAVRSTWLVAGGLHQLLEPPDIDDVQRRKERHRRSLLSGDYFRQQVLESVTTLLGDGPLKDRRVDVFLSATVLGGVSVSIADDPFAPDEAPRSNAVFHLRHHGPSNVQSDFVGEFATTRLATAARTTASYPFAFEPVCFAPGEMAGVLELPAEMSSDVYLLDGGVIDNIPVARALAGVPSVPAVTPTDRWIMYLHPSPGQPGGAGAASMRKPAGQVPQVWSVLKALGGALRTETILDDIEAVREHNLESVDEWRAWSQAVGTLPRVMPWWRVSTSQPLDSVRIYTLLNDPSAELVYRPIGLAVPPSFLTGLSVMARKSIREAIEADVTSLPASARPFAAHARIATLIIRWARAAESEHVDAGLVKSAAYDVLRVAQLLTVNAEWKTLVDLRFSPGVDGAVGRMYELSLAQKQCGEIRDLIAHLASGASLAQVGGPMRGTLLRLEGCGHIPPLSHREIDNIDALWTCIGHLATRLSSYRIDGDEVDAALLNDLRLRIGESEARAVKYLQYIDMRASSVHRGRAFGSNRAFTYVRAAGSNLSPLALGPEALSHDGPRFTSTLLTVRQGQTTMDACTKLAGSQLANFSAFLSERWRANDWMWGRLDLAKTIVDVATAPGRISFGQEDAAAVQVQRALTAPFEADVHGPWRTQLDDHAAALWTKHESTIRRELAEEGAARPHERLKVTKQLLVLRRQWEILGQDLPAVLQSSLTPLPEQREAAAVPRSMTEALEIYEREPRSITAVWGEAWLAALGVRSAYSLWSATRPRARVTRIMRAPLKPIPMSLLGIVLARHRSLLAIAMAINVILVPHIRSWVAWVAWAVGLLGLGVGAWLLRDRTAEHPHRTSRILLIALSAIATAYGLVMVLVRWRAPFTEIDQIQRGGLEISLNVDAIVIGTTAAILTYLSWYWARGRWRLLAAFVGGAIMMASSVWSTARHTNPGVLLQFAFVTRPLVVGSVAAVVALTALAHGAFRHRLNIANYGRR
jgi:hypothetical protein